MSDDSNIINFNSYRNFLDNEYQGIKLNLLKYIDDSHIMKRISQNISEITWMPESTVFLTQLSVFSSIACRRYCVQYNDGEKLPIGLYVIAEQPSGSAKSRCIKNIQQPFYNILKKVKHDINEKFKSIESLDGYEDEAKSLKHEINRLNYPLFITNATPESLDALLDANNGFFSAVSCEQGLLNSLLGKSYNSDHANNNDCLLYGFEGGMAGSSRVSRKAYSGIMVGGILCFAQPGSIDTILEESNGTGLSERFLLISEPHSLGKRDHTKEIPLDKDAFYEFEKRCEFFEKTVRNPIEYTELNCLHISNNGFDMINKCRNKIEPLLADEEKFSSSSLRGAAAKINMQIMKIAANLHITDNITIPQVICDKHIYSAIGIVIEMINSYHEICIEKGIIGMKAEFMSIINYLSCSNKPRSELEIINSLRSTKPFSLMKSNKSQLIRNSISELTKFHKIKVVATESGAKYTNN